MVLEDLGWTIHRIWSPDWASNKEREIRKIKQKISEITSGNTDLSETVDVPSYEPEAIDPGSKTDHDFITEFEEPSLDYDSRYDPNKHGNAKANRNAIEDTVRYNGPIKYDTAMQTYLEVWKQSRAGKKVQRIFRKQLNNLTRKNEVYESSEFLWPPRKELDFQVRVNTESDNRPIDEIPTEEVALALAIILEEGGSMTKDDLALETTRLFGYQRRGKRIKERIEDALDILEEEDLIELSDSVEINESRDAKAAILSRIYD
jgi:hypothetical protein